MRVGHGRRLDGRRRRARLLPNPTQQTNTSTDKAPHKQKKPRRGRLPVIIAAVLVIAAVGLGAVAWSLWAGSGMSMGTTIAAAEDGLTRDEIQAQLDEEVRANMMTVSVMPTMRLDPKTYELGVGAENVDENRFPQRFTLTQGSKTLWTSGVVMPGERIESVVAPLAEEGDARVEVQALDPETSAKHGSPTAVEVSIVTMTEEEDPA